MTNAQLGKLNEYRVLKYCEKLGWSIQKTGLNYDKYHNIDFIATTPKKWLVFIQVKPISYFNNKIEDRDKLIQIAQKYNGSAYYFYVGKKIYRKKVYENEKRIKE